MNNKISILILFVFIISIGSLVFILTSDYRPDYLLGYGIPISFICGTSMIALVLSQRIKCPLHYHVTRRGDF